MLYPVAIEKGSEHCAFGVVVPDVPGCFSAGDTFEEALINAKEALELHLQSLAEMEELPPLASCIDHHIAKPEFNGWVWALVDIDTELYL
jgi:predicted RNase H-like HicB family nuclease